MVSLEKRPPLLLSTQIASAVKIAAETVQDVANFGPAWDVQEYQEVRAAFSQVLYLAAKEMEYVRPR